MGIKALAIAVIQGNQQGNQRETKSFLPSKLRKLEQTPRKHVVDLPEWQNNFCISHAEFNQWRECCPCSLDDCLISRIIDADGDIDKLRGLEIGHGITSDQVIDEWIEAGEPVVGIFKAPMWVVCFADHLQKGKKQ